jgi:LAO/AO transport system kinase
MSQTAAGIAAGVLAREIGAGARLIRWLEEGDPRGRDALATIYPHTGQAHLIGITGPPGAGKSTLTNALISEQRKRGRRVGVIAVDPSSPFSGGAVLGDRVRMQTHALDTGVFIRSMGTRGQLGGLSRATFDAILVQDAMGYDVVIVETVGVGQDELDIVSLAHSTVIVSVPGLGDEVQAIKAGLLEAGDLFVVNKADRDGADALTRQLELMLHLREQTRPSDWTPPLVHTTALTGQGVATLTDELDRHLAMLKASGGFTTCLKERNRHMFESLLQEQAARQILAAALAEPSTAQLISAVQQGDIDPYSAAAQLVGCITLKFS